MILTPGWLDSVCAITGNFSRISGADTQHYRIKKHRIIILCTWTAVAGCQLTSSSSSKQGATPMSWWRAILLPDSESAWNFTKPSLLSHLLIPNHRTVLLTVLGVSFTLPPPRVTLFPLHPPPWGYSFSSDLAKSMLEQNVVRFNLAWSTDFSEEPTCLNHAIARSYAPCID